VHEVNSMLNKHSGLLAVSGISGDVREVLSAASQGDANAALSLDMYEYRIRKYIGGYAAAMDGVDVLLFTGGVGENAAYLRERVCAKLSYLGVKLDPELNAIRSGEDRIISTPDSRVKVMIIPTNEELMIARKTYSLLGAGISEAEERYELQEIGRK
jgi:acetate kinase